MSEDLYNSARRQSQSSVVEDVPDTGRSGHTAASFTAGQSSKALSDRDRMSSVAEDVKSRSVSRSGEKSADQKSRRSEHHDDSADESVATEISSKAK